MASTAVPIYGLTVLIPIYGQGVGTGIVGLAALVTNLAQVSVAVYLLQSAAASSNGSARSVGSSSTESSGSVTLKAVPAPSALTAIDRSAANPLVWCPVLGAAFALSGLPLSQYVFLALSPLAVSAAGVAIFAGGLALAEHPLKLT